MNEKTSYTTNGDYVAQVAHTISEEMKDPKNWKRNENYFSQATIRPREKSENIERK